LKGFKVIFVRESEILKIDSRGRIVIPRSMRKTLGLKENSFIMLISDPEEKEIRMIPLPFSDEQAFVRLRIIMADEPGALSRVAKVLGDLGLNLLYGQEVVIKKGVESEWSVISPLPSDLPIENFKQQLIEKGGAKRVIVERPNKS